MAVFLTNSKSATVIVFIVLLLVIEDLSVPFSWRAFEDEDEDEDEQQV